MLNVVLVEPEIPQNTGNIARTCAATHTKLHLVRPLGFEITDKHLKRAGLDYWPYVDISYYDSFAELVEKHPDGKFWYLSTKGKIRYTDVKFEDNCFLVFGKETKGLPEDLLYSNYDRCIRIPMYQDLRSLNLSNSVAIVLYEALRQHDFFDLR
ncbi:MAG TPA: tRNA (uridine(34)/cytosine(34)/5-carboxymethylaminomethyluridine(34)-2'-O)-methyltransferase TrmL [Clostridia bacterium]